MSRNNTNNFIDCEILAPAGSYQCMTAAFNGGADAVYVGGSMFGARAYADNFGQEELINAIDYAHLIGKKLYLTVNTLLKSEEIQESLLEYITPLYEAGLDAVIVQDMGVLRKIHCHFPNLPIHASTQMTVTGVNFAMELKRLGVTRIVTPRELSYDEIKNIYEATGLEIESFVHGALCYSYSGQCLLSSMIGGRSGNRGRCAQPCRLNYDFYREAEKINKANDKYLLSPKDMCTLDILPQILKSGVYSLKIEGRMKKPEYVAGVVSTYRKYVDIIKEKGTYTLDENDVENLRDIYNRGGFTDGFYERHNGREMMSLYKPNHYGVKVAEIISISKNSINLKALKDIDERDVLEINLWNNTSCGITIGKSIKSGSDIAAKNSIPELKGMNSLYDKGLYRTRNNRLIQTIEENIIEKQFKVKISGDAVIMGNKPMELNAVMKYTGSDGKPAQITEKAFGAIPAAASNKPADKNTIFKQLNKTGGTDFEFERLDIYLDDNLFIPVSALNELRRKCLDSLKSNVLAGFRRNYCRAAVECEASKEAENQKQAVYECIIECVVSEYSQLKQVLKKPFVSAAALELSRFSYTAMESHIAEIKACGMKAYIALPYICRDAAIQEFEDHRDFFVNAGYDGMIVRNYEEYIYFARLFEKEKLSKKFVFDSNVYMFNNETKTYLHELGKEYNTLDTVLSIPYELNQKEIKRLGAAGCRMEIYGYIPVMVTAGCVKKTTGRCDGNQNEIYYLKDRMNNKLSVMTNCRYCYNIIFNSVPLYLGNELADLRKMGIYNYSLRFTVENGEKTEEVLNKVMGNISGIAEENIKTDYTRGHFRRGVM